MIEGPVLSPMSVAISASESPLWRACVTKYERKPWGVTCPNPSLRHAFLRRLLIVQRDHCAFGSNGDGNSRWLVARFCIPRSKTSISGNIGTKGIMVQIHRFPFERQRFADAKARIRQEQERVRYVILIPRPQPLLDLLQPFWRRSNFTAMADVLGASVTASAL